jgi:glutaminase
VDIEQILEDTYDAVRPLIGSGAVAEYIPRLAAVNPEQFGMAVVMNDGREFHVGDSSVQFSVQSMSKVFSLALVLAGDGESIWHRVGREPSGAAFNSLTQLEYSRGVPRNPFVNAGALVVTDQLLTDAADELDGRLGLNPILDFVRTESENLAISADPLVASSEAEHSHRNAAIAHLLSSFGNLQNPVGDVLERYFEQCAISMNCRDVAAATSVLARGGLRRDGSRLLSASQAKRINSVMLTSGFYDAAGEFAYRVGLPGKSGVGGGILAVVPGQCSICVWAPGLNASGNSLVGVAALDEFTTRTGWSIF